MGVAARGTGSRGGGVGRRSCLWPHIPSAPTEPCNLTYAVSSCDATIGVGRRDALKRTGSHGEHSLLEPAAVCVHDHVPLFVSATDDGAGVDYCVFQMAAVARWGGAVWECGAVLGADFWCEFCHWRCDRDSDGVSVRDELGDFFEVFGECHWADAGDGGALCVFS